MTQPSIEQILDVIKKRPGINTNDIASALGRDSEDVHAALIPAISKGQVLADKIEGPVGKRTAYTMNTTFLGWSSAPASKPAAAHAQHKATHISKTDMAVAYLKAHARASSEVLAKAMGLKKGTQPHGYLKGALQDNRLARDGQDWVLGNGEPLKQQEADTPTPSIPIAPKFTATHEDASPASPPHCPPEPVHSSLIVGNLRIIQWTNGSLVLSANDSTVDLNADQARALRAFVSLT